MKNLDSGDLFVGFIIGLLVLLFVGGIIVDIFIVGAIK